MAVIYVLKLKLWLRNDPVPKSFLLRNRPYTHLSTIAFILDIICDEKTCIGTVQSQLCGALTVSSMISLYLAGK